MHANEGVDIDRIIELVKPLLDKAAGGSLRLTPIQINDTKMQSMGEVPRVRFEITQRMQDDPFAKRQLPNVGFYLKSLSKIPVRFRVEVYPMLGDRIFGVIQDPKKYYTGETVWGPFDCMHAYLLSF